MRYFVCMHTSFNQVFSPQLFSRINVHIICIRNICFRQLFNTTECPHNYALLSLHTIQSNVFPTIVFPMFSPQLFAYVIFVSDNYSIQLNAPTIMRYFLCIQFSPMFSPQLFSRINVHIICIRGNICFRQLFNITECPHNYALLCLHTQFNQMFSPQLLSRINVHIICIRNICFRQLVNTTECPHNYALLCLHTIQSNVFPTIVQQNKCPYYLHT